MFLGGEFKFSRQWPLSRAPLPVLSSLSIHSHRDIRMYWTEINIVSDPQSCQGKNYLQTSTRVVDIDADCLSFAVPVL